MKRHCLSSLSLCALLCLPMRLPFAMGQDAPATLQLTVDQAIALALRQNRELLMRGESVRHYKALKDVARAAYMPKISNSSHASYVTDLEGVVIPAGAFGSPAAAGPVPARTLRLDQGAEEDFGVGTHLTQPVTGLLRVHAQNRSARADLATAKLGVDDEEETLAVTVRQLFSAVQEDQQEELAAEASERAAREVLRESEAAQRAGSSLTVDDLANEADILESQQTQLKVRVTLHKDELQLADVLGVPLQTHFQLLDTPGAMEPLPARPEGVALALAQQPEVKMAEQAVEKAEAQLHEAELAYVPDVDAVATQAYQSGVPFLVHNFGVFEASFSFDLFDGGAREAKVRDARSGLQSARLALAQAKDDVAVAVEEAYDKLDQANQTVTLASQTMKLRAEALRLAQAQLDHGEALLSARDKAQANLLNAQADEISAQLDATLAQAAILRTLGRVAR